ncbi:MAG TPA: serine hydrolase domain-containing protein [Actinocrinis sp.]|uniref:serine hydrolase domain-containing protein n=1 Tax=Actinocrinis sp. TaxID=1920516 RepID=UPI002D4688C2|nr:serine hydrolase domain-containing protein [Actinocrinis sp.]HZU57403.1 serine hydrolase domain-containing protein [Actinocrinis sp.]
MALHRRTLLGVLAAAGITVSGAVPAAFATESGDRPDVDLDVDAFDEYLEQCTAAGAFSGAVLVARDHRTLLAKGYGQADRARGITNTPGTKFCVCSMGKMFTAVGIAQLVERGRLSFGDTIGAHLSGFPAVIADNVTIDQLLTHTSGMGDVLARTGGSMPPTTLAGLIREIEQQPLLFPPGTGYSYSNSGFIVLGAIIQAAAGQAYDEYVHDHIFAPSGMRHTSVRVYTADQVVGMAHGYALVGNNQYQDTGDMVQIGNPSGGAYSTVFDMLGFARALTGHRLLTSEMTDTVLTGRVPISRPGGPADDEYAYGFEVQTINGIRIVGHNGGSPGYEGQLDIYLDRGYVAVVLTNQDHAMVPAIQKSEALLT